MAVECSVHASLESNSLPGAAAVVSAGPQQTGLGAVVSNLAQYQGTDGGKFWLLCVVLVG